MSVRLYVGNISYRATEDDLHAAFAGVVAVRSVHLPVDRETGRLRGFGFVEVDTDAAAETLIQTMQGQMVLGRALVISLAHPRTEHPPRRVSGGAVHNRRPRGGQPAEHRFGSRPV
jgi:RNA recognition motif-containing protein